MKQISGYTALVLTLFMLGVQVPALAASHNDGNSADDTMLNELRAQIQSDRKALIAENLTMTSEQKTKFWPLYDEYHAKRSKLVTKRIELLRKFARDRIGITAKDAEDILKEAIKTDQKLADLKAKYRNNFVKVLQPRGALRFYQIENKIDATINYDVASVVPLQPK